MTALSAGLKLCGEPDLGHYQASCVLSVDVSQLDKAARLAQRTNVTTHGPHLLLIEHRNVNTPSTPVSEFNIVQCSPSAWGRLAY